MRNYLRATITGICLLSIVLLVVAPVANAGLKEGLKTAQETARGAGLLSDETTTGKDIVLNIINFVLGLVGVLAVLFLIIAGVMYITSLGDEGKAEKAKKMILYIIIGIILIVLAAVIVNTALNLRHPADLPL